jgi:hypothetical protein
MEALDWLLDSDPSIRWQALRDLTPMPAEELLVERARIATQGWGARLLSLQGDDGQWDGGTEVEPCINGMTVALGAYFGEDVDGVVERLLAEQLADGGWNCEAERGSTRSSFGSTISVLEGLLEHERATGGSQDSVAARQRGEEYLLERGLLRRKTTGELIDRSWLQFSFPTRWFYDVLRGLEYFRAVGAPPDGRPSRWNTLRALRVLKWYEHT